MPRATVMLLKNEQRGAVFQLSSMVTSTGTSVPPTALVARRTKSSAPVSSASAV